MDKVALYSQAPKMQSERRSNGMDGNNWQTHRGKENVRRTKEEKAKLICDHCHFHGNEMKECFKLHGYPEWYKTFKEQKSRSAVNLVDTAPDSIKPIQKEYGQEKQTPDIAALVQEITKYMASNSSPLNFGNTDFAHSVEYSGIHSFSEHHIALSTFEHMNVDSWILDTGASRHMCTSSSQMHNLTLLSSPVVVYLPDGSTKSVTHSGKVTLTPHLTMSDVLLVSSFKYNLLSIAQLTQTHNLTCVFSPSHCLFQDPKTEQVIAVGKAVGRLYVLNPSTSSKSVIPPTSVAQ
ncbi:hypothetical protein DH2020_002194 [Rehmannia glutinosa]|uniref:Retrovirus-related Pol polyprotein from transposon TNT 1-94-like beta-barrel domain-containing protein n=1 Tax=Rehmannia glutinosa TaxID=99300 RepID=A0ABR0XTD6_REHGL